MVALYILLQMTVTRSNIISCNVHTTELSFPCSSTDTILVRLERHAATPAHVPAKRKSQNGG